MKTGYLYVLVHPSNPNLAKFGHTTRKPEERLAEHNSNCEELTSRIVKETGQKWELKEYFPVPDPAYAEAAFWETLCPGFLKQPKGIEVMEGVDWELAQMALDAAKKAGLRPPTKPLHDWVYAYTKWMSKRLEGRDISLLGYVKSMVSGNATFRCNNGHEWRTRALYVAEGKGCPQCGVGDRKLEEIWQSAKLGYLNLLIHPDKPGLIKIALTYLNEENILDGWEVHRFRFVEEPVLAETLIWKLLGQPKPNDGEPIKIDLKIAEQAFGSLIYEMYRQIALAEKKKGQWKR